MPRYPKREIGDDNYVGVLLDWDTRRKLEEMSKVTLQSFSELVAIGLNMIYESSPWPELIPHNKLTEFMVHLSRTRGWDLEEWCRQRDVELHKVYYIFRKLGAGKRPGNSMAATETRRVRRLIEDELGLEHGGLLEREESLGGDDD